MPPTRLPPPTPPRPPCTASAVIKGPYIEISTLLSEYLVIQVQEGIKSNVQIVLHALAVVSGIVVLSSLITNCIHALTEKNALPQTIFANS